MSKLQTPHFSEVRRGGELPQNCFDSFVPPSVDKPLKRFSYTRRVRSTSLK